VTSRHSMLPTYNVELPTPGPERPEFGGRGGRCDQAEERALNISRGLGT
jgi:hypothetical protein